MNEQYNNTSSFHADDCNSQVDPDDSFYRDECLSAKAQVHYQSSIAPHVLSHVPDDISSFQLPLSSELFIRTPLYSSSFCGVHSTHSDAVSPLQHSFEPPSLAQLDGLSPPVDHSTPLETYHAVPYDGACLQSPPSSEGGSPVLCRHGLHSTEPDAVPHDLSTFHLLSTLKPSSWPQLGSSLPPVGRSTSSQEAYHAVPYDLQLPHSSEPSNPVRLCRWSLPGAHSTPLDNVPHGPSTSPLQQSSERSNCPQLSGSALSHHHFAPSEETVSKRSFLQLPSSSELSNLARECDGWLSGSYFTALTQSPQLDKTMAKKVHEACKKTFLPRYPPTFFVYEDNGMMPLRDALDGIYKRLQMKDTPVLEGCGRSISLQIQIMGYERWTRVINVKCSRRRLFVPITLAKLSHEIAKSVARFIELHEDVEVSPEHSRWKVGHNALTLDCFLLKSLVQVSEATFEPILVLDESHPYILTGHHAR